MPLALPRENESNGQIGQIPEPGNVRESVGQVHDPLGNTLHKPNTGNAGQMEDTGEFTFFYLK